eukprot:TRINITY_DN16424_c0_g1_i2.p1 TRINITY_DN16424_c0_g1~~TRINITY_DN16424_c0_g1_i2.p1  ORF type:complete len:143 (+),score=18.69 TRINITY_DN16424_c0_g1_i2:234-662(+)
MSFSVSCQLVDGTNEFITVGIDTKVIDLKKNVAEMNGTSTDMFDVIFSGEKLNDHTKILDHGITGDSELIIEINAKGQAIQRIGGEQNITDANFFAACRDGHVGTVADFIAAGYTAKKKHPVAPLYVAVWYAPFVFQHTFFF